ncbi:MAG TPA: type II toxin-antitoxin system prevent-host-death family antitoxin [Solirubrobacteraceae bacterium]
MSPRRRAPRCRSRVLREVEAGEVVEITDRGRPVAHLTPVPHMGPLARLRAAGRMADAATALGMRVRTPGLRR